MLEYLQSIFTQPWKPISRPALIAWLVSFTGYLFYIFSAHGHGTVIDMANLIVHEGGHNLFGWLGPTLGLWGGTLLQWLVPFLLAVYFFSERQIPGFVFSLFFFFDNWLYTATYMADARAMELPLVTTGDPDLAEHDFHAIFSNLGVLDYDTRIAAVVRFLGWCGMIGCVVWLAWRARLKEQSIPAPIAFPAPAIPLVQRFPGKPRTAASSSNHESTVSNSPTAPNPQ